MTLDHINSRRRFAGAAAALCYLLFCISALDGLISRFGENPHEVRLLPGESAAVNGPASEGVRDPQDLTVTSDSDLIRLSVEKIHTGFWLGGLMWRGTVTTSSTLEAGDYTLTVSAPSEPSGRPLATFRIRVFQDAASLLKSAGPILQRTIGISPWWLAAIFLPLAVICSGIVFFCSQKREQFLRQEGKAEVYRVSRSDEGFEVSFALGTRQGVRVGSVLTLLDSAGDPVGSVTVRDVFEEDATATVSPDCLPRPGFLVLLP